MKNSSLTILAFAGLGAIATLGTSCQKSDAATAKVAEKAPENGAKFKKGEGVSLTDQMKKSIGFQTAEVTEEEVPSTLTIDFTATGSQAANGPLTAQKAAFIKPGMEMKLAGEGLAPELKGVVQSIDKIPFGTAGDLEVTISTSQPLPQGSNFKGIIDIPASGSVAAVPAAALLKTAEGTFVYAVNGNFYVRTPVKIGASNDKLVEITDGLYSGDQIVTKPVMSLWMAELQVLRGGKACTCGH